MLAIGSTYHRFLRRPAIALAVLAAAVAAAAVPARAAQAASLVVSGGGFGHGVGMSQQGALGYAEHGWSYQ
jgi:stage II sporulation protein D